MRFSVLDDEKAIKRIAKNIIDNMQKRREEDFYHGKARIFVTPLEPRSKFHHGSLFIRPTIDTMRALRGDITIEGNICPSCGLPITKEDVESNSVAYDNGKYYHNLCR